MNQIAVIELKAPTDGRFGRVFLDRKMLEQVRLTELELELEANFVDPEDKARMGLIESFLDTYQSLQISIFPGEQAPPEFHAYFRDPKDPESRLFACVLVPEPIVRKLLEAPPHMVFETETFQVMGGDTSPASLQAAFESWARRVWPNRELPRFQVLPWPVEEVHSQPPVPSRQPKGVPRGAVPLLPQTDFPTGEELSA
jgi:hypothetical protein